MLVVNGVPNTSAPFRKCRLRGPIVALFYGPDLQPGIGGQGGPKGIDIPNRSRNVVCHKRPVSGPTNPHAALPKGVNGTV
jgi:hypothetical protein